MITIFPLSLFSTTVKNIEKECFIVNIEVFIVDSIDSVVLTGEVVGTVFEVVSVKMRMVVD